MRNYAGNVIPTAAQVEVALRVQQNFAHNNRPSQVSTNEGMLFQSAMDVLNSALRMEDWDGSTETCPPFGFESKKKEEKKDDIHVS